MSAIISVSALTKNFFLYSSQLRRTAGFIVPQLRQKLGREFRALDNVKFSIQPGESVALIGKNGSGKSTLLKILCGVSIPSSGSMSVEGKIAALLELGAGFNPELTGRENIFLIATIHRIEKEDIEARVPSILEFAEIGELIDQPVKHYSSGMFARLGFAIAVHLKADIFIIDEALSVGDSRFQLRCLAKMRELKAAGKTLIFVSHDMAILNNFTERAIWLEKGSIRADGKTSEVTKQYLSEVIYDLPTSGDFSLQSENLEHAAQFGGQRATIKKVQLLDERAAAPAALLRGGEPLKLEIEFYLSEANEQLGVGALFKDALGNSLFGFNNYIFPHSFGPLTAGTYQVAIRFEMPSIENGSYFGSVSLSNGTQLTHEQLHWIHDAIRIEVANRDPKFNCGTKLVIDRPVDFALKRSSED